MDKSAPMSHKPLVNTTCALGKNGCFNDGRCHALGSCEHKITTNADRIRAMSDEELAEFCEQLAYIEPVWDRWFGKTFCDKCEPFVGEYEGESMEFHECEASDGGCPHGNAALCWLREPAEGEGE